MRTLNGEFNNRNMIPRLKRYKMFATIQLTFVCCYFSYFDWPLQVFAEMSFPSRECLKMREEGGEVTWRGVERTEDKGLRERARE